MIKDEIEEDKIEIETSVPLPTYKCTEDPYMWDYKSSPCCLEFPIFLILYNSYIKRILNSYQGYEYDVKCIFLNNFTTINLISRTGEISCSSVAAVKLPAAKDTVTREKEDNIVETEEELGIFQLLDRLEEVTSRLTSRWQESMESMVLSLLFYSLCPLYN